MSDAVSSFNNVSKVEEVVLIDAGQSYNAAIPFSSSQESQAESTNPVRFVRSLVGDDAVLLPVVKGEKHPAISGWQEMTLEDTQGAEYVRQLEAGSIGVLLGAVSNHLCAIDIDDDNGVDPFLKLNPLLRHTLRSRGGRGAQVWVRLEGEYPSLAKLKTKLGSDWGEWRAEGGQSVIHGIHKSGVPYQIQQHAQPVNIAFKDIVWPSDLKLPWVKSDFDQIAQAEGDPFTISERGSVMLNQMFFVSKYALENHILFDSSLGDFFQYDPAEGLWKKQTVDAIKRGFLKDLARAATETRLAPIFLKRTDAIASALVALLRATVETRDAFSKRCEAIHVANGMIVFEGDEVLLKSFHPDYRSRNQCPYAFDPAAVCPRFLKELLSSALDQADQVLLQKWAGSVLLGRNASQRFLMLLGTPAGGKSTVMNVLERAIGLVNVAQLRTEHLSDKFELYGFAGKTLLTGKDVAADFLMHKGAHVLKALVGHDLLEAEKKGFNERVQLVGDFNVGITCNADLNIRLQGDAGAWRRRLLVIKYDRPPVKRKIPGFADQLLSEEGAGILRWMVEGAIALLDDLKQTGDYRLTTAQQSGIDRLMDQSDSVKRFVTEGVARVKGHDVSNAELVATYYEFCEAHGWQPFGARELRTDLTKHMLEIHRASSSHDIMRQMKSARGYRNISLVQGGEQND